MDTQRIIDKFGDAYEADDRAYIMGIDQRFTAHFAERFANMRVLEACTGGGFSTIALARTAAHVHSVDIDLVMQQRARNNVTRAGLMEKVSFVPGSMLDPGVLDALPEMDAAFLDPDWAVNGPDHEYRFRNSTTQPPADAALETLFSLTRNIALVLPPFIDLSELAGLPEHELQSLYMGDSHELYCLYFGTLARNLGRTELRV